MCKFVWFQGEQVDGHTALLELVCILQETERINNYLNNYLITTVGPALVEGYQMLLEHCNKVPNLG